MGNKLFQEARRFTEQAIEQPSEENINIAKNSLSSAYANTNLAEQAQLSVMQANLKETEAAIKQE